MPDSHKRAFTAERAPRSRFYDGRIYGRLVEPMMRNLHGFVAKQVAAVTRLLDAGCGTGGLAFRLAEQGRQVTGVDLSPRNIAYAERRRHTLGLENVRFEVGDASRLDQWDDGEFEVVTAVMVLHEMPAQSRAPVLAELARVGQRVMVVDFAAPMPKNLAGLRNRLIELTAGREHFGAFRDFTRRGGLDAVVTEAGLTVERERRVDSRTLDFKVLARA